MNKMVHLKKEVKKLRRFEDQNKDKESFLLFPLSHLLTFLSSYLLLLIVSAMSILTGSCTPTGTPIYTLGTPRFVPQSAPDDSTETGIGQDPNSSGEGIFLQWYKIAGASQYNVYRTTTKDINGMPTGFKSIKIVSQDTSFVDGDGIIADTTYFYRIQANALDRSESNFSDTVHITLLARVAPTSPGMNANVDASNLSFTWRDPTGGGSTLIRVKDSTGYIWVSRDTSIYGAMVAKYNFDGNGQPLVSGHSYQWRIDRINPGTDQQAKSIWQKFFVK